MICFCAAIASAFPFQSMITSAGAGVESNVANNVVASITATRSLALDFMGKLRAVGALEGRSCGRADVAKALVWRRWTASINDTTEELFSTRAAL